MRFPDDYLNFRMDLLINRMDDIQETQQEIMSMPGRMTSDPSPRAPVSPSSVVVKLPPQLDNRLGNLERQVIVSLAIHPQISLTPHPSPQYHRLLSVVVKLPPRLDSRLGSLERQVIMPLYMHPPPPPPPHTHTHKKNRSTPLLPSFIICKMK